MTAGPEEIRSDYDAKIIHQKLIELFSDPTPPTAVFCADDQLVPDVYRTLEELKKRIPEDVSVLGRGNLPIGTVLKPRLSSIAIPAFEMGKKAAEMLIHAVNGQLKSAQRLSLEAPLVERESTWDRLNISRNASRA